MHNDENGNYCAGGVKKCKIEVAIFARVRQIS